MIKYSGIKSKGQVYYVLFSNELNNVVEVPISKADAERIAIYVDKISTRNRAPIERNNDEPADIS